jgi:phosphatidylinositol-3-phosphatase
MRRVMLAVVAAALGAAVLSTGAATARPTAEGVPQFGHVFVIVGENTKLNQLTPNNTPYLATQFKPRSAWLTGYYATTHFSTANYVAMTSGQFTPCEQEDDPPVQCHQNVPNIFGQLDARGLSWQSWMESMPQPCDLTDFGSSSTYNSYRVKHNPAVYFDDVEGPGGVWSTTPSAECNASDIPMGGTGPNDTSAFDAALASGNVGRFNYIVPNECEDSHDQCKPAGSRLVQFDQFLKREVPQIEASPAFGSDGLIIVVFDEATASTLTKSDRFGRGGNVLWAALGPQVKPGVYGGSFDHYSFLRTLEDGFRLDGYVGNAATAAPINTIWH